MRFFELFENNRAPLYHNTNIENANTILNAGEIKPAGDEMIDPEVSISLTRDRRYGEELYGPIKFEIDGNKLRNTHKISPVDFDRQNAIDNDNENPPIRNEREERVYKPIPLKYVSAVRDKSEKLNPKFAAKVIERGIPYFYKNKPIAKDDLPKADYVITDPGLTFFEVGEKISSAELKQALEMFGKDSFSYKPQ